MLVNKTQQKAHATALKNLHEQATRYIATVDDAHATSVDVHIERDKLNDAISWLRELNELMNHTVDEDEGLKNAFADWLNPNKDSYHTVQAMIELSE